MKLDSRIAWRDLGIGIMLWVASPLIIIVCFFIAAWIVATDRIGR